LSETVNQHPALQYVTVVCPVCHARLDERVTAAPQTIKCPDCFTELRVPAADEIKAAQPDKKPQPEVGTYQLQSPSDAPEHASARQRKRDEEVVLVVCKVCGARLHPSPKREPRAVQCPDCHEPVRVPSLMEAAERKRREQIPALLQPVQALPVPAPEPRPELSTEYWEMTAVIQREEEPDPPRWTFFSGVFTFPWHAEVWWRWLLMSLGLSVLGLIVGLVTLIFLGTSNYSGIVLAFFVLPAAWITIWTVSYGASCWLVVVEDTASGNQRTHNWQQESWRDWVLTACYVGYVVCQSCVVGYGTGLLAELTGIGFWQGMLPTAWVAFPILILSSLEAGLWWVPLTKPIVQSLAKHVGAWLMYYVLSTVVVGGGAAAGMLFLTRLPVAGLLLLGPIWSTVVLIHARLLGRLGSLISVAE
jgi:hypothetical protein